MTTRYAIYFVPAPDSALYRFGASVLGTDCYSGRAVPFPGAADADWAEAVRAPRVYGFHATLKAPFRPAPGIAQENLAGALDAFARERSVIDAGVLNVTTIGSFLALVPAMPCPPLERLAADCTRQFDRFRAPMTEAERARRLSTPLTARQMSHLDRWGYPYVLDDFRFHMTLGGPLPEPARAQAQHWLAREWADRPSARGLIVDRLALARQDGGAFRVVHAAPLGMAPRPTA
jgi:putative phosphonate metabolism protein